MSTETTVASLVAKANIPLGITSDDALLTWAVEGTLDKVLVDLRQPFLPALLYNTVAEMCVDAYRMAKAAAGEEAGKVVGSISSVSDNGQSVSYRESPYAAAISAACKTILKDYDRQLAAYRRAGW
jgi:hypothetical protein